MHADVQKTQGYQKTKEPETQETKENTRNTHLIRKMHGRRSLRVAAIVQQLGAPQCCDTSAATTVQHKSAGQQKGILQHNVPAQHILALPPRVQVQGISCGLCSE